MAKSVTKIPQTRNIFTAAPITGIAKRKVAGYARVSTDSDEQFTSYEAQVSWQQIRSVLPQSTACFATSLLLI